MPIQGFVRLRKHQFGRQQVFGTKVAATRAYPHTGTPSADLAWTGREVDAGSRDPVAAPYRAAPDLTAGLDSNSLTYNDLVKLHSGFFGGGVEPTGGGTAQTWAFAPASETVDTPDVYTYEFGDDVLTDWEQYGDGIIESFTITGPEGLGALTSTENGRFGSYSNTGSTDAPVDGTVPTPGLSVAIDDTIIYLKDIAIYIADDPDDLAAGQIVDALHTFEFSGEQEVDQKRFANGDQSFDIDAYGPGARSLTLTCTYAKTADTVGLGSESDHWTSDEAVNRYIRIVATSKVLAQTPSTFYTWTLTMPMRYYTREHGEIGGNTTIILEAHAFFDAYEFDGVLESTIVNTLTAAELGEAGS